MLPTTVEKIGDLNNKIDEVLKSITLSSEEKLTKIRQLNLYIGKVLVEDYEIKSLENKRKNKGRL